MSLNQTRLLLALIVALAYIILPPLLLADRPYYLGVLTTASVLSVISAGVWLTFYIGRINIGQGAFALVGGYSAAIVVTEYGWSFWFAIVFGGLFAALCGVVIGAAVLRLRGVYFAMLSLSLTETARLVAQSFSGVTGGATGITDIPLPGALSLFGLTIIPDFAGLNKHVAFYSLAAILTVLCFVMLWRIVNSRIGQLFYALQQNEDLAASIGLNVARLRLVAYAIACFVGGLGGAFFMANQQSIYPASFSIQDSVYFMLYCFLGGLSFVFGPLVGAFVLFIGFEYLHGLNQYQPLLYAILIIGLILWLPNGLLSLRPPNQTLAWLKARLSSLATPKDDR